MAKDGIAALERAKSLNPDIILMDIDLPKLDGISAIQRIRTESATTHTDYCFNCFGNGRRSGEMSRRRCKRIYF
jgi:hypothetical protein